jgi:hypothetical protein
MIDRYSIYAEGDPHESELIITADDTGEWVKFDDINEYLSAQVDCLLDIVLCGGSLTDVKNYLAKRIKGEGE